MKYLTVFLLLLVTACASTGQPEPPPTEAPPTELPSVTPTSSPEPTATPTPKPITFETPNFVFQGDDPAIPMVTRQPSPSIKNYYINPGAVLFYQGQFHMFFNSFSAWPGVIQVGYMTSPDGYDWQMQQDEPVFSTDQVPFGQGHADISSVIVTEDGTWRMYFHTISAGQIGIATSPSPLGPWQVHPKPVLEAGSQGSWDQYGLYWPSVIGDEQGYRMYYGGKFASGMAIGLASSKDGIHWQKYNDPDTADEAYSESDPVLMASADWQYNRIDRPRVQHTPDGWVMIFQAGSIEKRSMALSNDGIHWDTYPDNPILTREKFPIPNAKTWDTTLVYQTGAYYYYMELGSLDGTDLYLAVHQGDLRK